MSGSPASDTFSLASGSTATSRASSTPTSGRPELAAAVEAAPRRSSPEAGADAEALLDELEDGWLRDQVAGLRDYAGVLAGETVSYADEVEQCYGVRPNHTDEAVFEEAHAHLDELLPGGGKLRGAVRGSGEGRWSCRRSRSSAWWRPSWRWRARGQRGLIELPAGEGRGARDRPRRAVDGVLLLPGRPPEPDLGQRRPAEVGQRDPPSHDARDVPGPPRRAVREGAAARAGGRAARGDDRARADAAVDRGGGHRRARARHGARERRRPGDC